MARTLIEETREGRVPEEVKLAAGREGVPPERLARRIASGRAILIRSLREPERAACVGLGLTTKVNVNVGTSTEVVDLQMELEKVKVAGKWADTLMDLSVGGDLDEIRRAVIRESRLPVGTVPVYQAFVEAARRGGGAYFTEDGLFNTIERHLKDGVAFMTLHAAVTRELALKALRGDRLIPIVSRGGDMMVGWMLCNNAENPLHARWDYVLELFREYDAVISIGDALRPGALADSHDELHTAELLEAARLVKRALKAGVQVMVEGPGHVPLNEIAWDVRLVKRLTGGAPYYVLGPLPTDVAAPYDHIAGAIGAALAGAAGADLLCYITPAEHLSLPNVKQVEEGVIAFRIAAHVADVVKLGARARKWDDEVSAYRSKVMWDKVISRLIDPESAYRVYTQFGQPRVRACTMCGGYCPVMTAAEQARRAAGAARQ
jgi:phosphomethylpyrimidine synthase